MSSVTIVVPTYNESGNVPELVRRLDAVREQAGIDEVILANVAILLREAADDAQAVADRVTDDPNHRDRRGGAGFRLRPAASSSGTRWSACSYRR